jgi:hypothetical protein
MKIHVNEKDFFIKPKPMIGGDMLFYCNKVENKKQFFPYRNRFLYKTLETKRYVSFETAKKTYLNDPVDIQALMRAMAVLKNEIVQLKNTTNRTKCVKCHSNRMPYPNQNSIIKVGYCKDCSAKRKRSLSSKKSPEAMLLIRFRRKFKNTYGINTALFTSKTISDMISNSEFTKEDADMLTVISKNTGSYSSISDFELDLKRTYKKRKIKKNK